MEMYDCLIVLCYIYAKPCELIFLSISEAWKKNNRHEQEHVFSVNVQRSTGYLLRDVEPREKR